MQNTSDAAIFSGANFLSAFHREIADANNPLRFHRCHHFAQMRIAHAVERGAFRHRQFVRRAIPSAFFEERKRAIIHNEMFAEEFFR